jgi:ATP-dependent helicase HrpB
MPRPEPSPLPIDAVLPELLAALAGAPAAVLEAPPGAGKTTRVPPALLAAEGLLAEGSRVVVLEPRRVAARAAARRVASERGWRLGEEVGYQVRFDRRAGAATRLLFVTEGILVQQLQADPFLEGIGALIFDEIHERALTTDLSLAMARKVQRDARPDLKLLAMSATLDAGPLAVYLGGEGAPAPVVSSEGRLYPVEVLYDERGLDRAAPPWRLREELAARVAGGVRRALAASPGDVLVFLPGVGEIRAAQEALAPLARTAGLALLPLYGDLPAADQDAALQPQPRRKVVLATNVAETSVTVDGVTAVVDSGLARVLRYDPASGLDRLELSRISAASAEQRTGRAGRQADGWCLRLWSELDHRTLAPREEPEIRRVDLASPALQLLAWGESDLTAFGWLDPPEPERLELALALLRQLGALDRAGVTTLGRALARLPLHPRLGRLLLEGAVRGHPETAALAAALLAERDPFSRRRDRPARPAGSDLLEPLDQLRAFERSGRAAAGLHAGAAHGVLRARDQLLRWARQLDAPGAQRSGEDAVSQEEALGRALFAAFADRLACRREPGSDRAVMVGGRGVRLVAESAVREAALFVGVQMDAGRRGERSEALVRLASAVEPDWLPEERLETATETGFDAERERVIGWLRTRYRDQGGSALVIDEREAPVTDAALAAETLAAAAREALAGERPERALPLDDPALVDFLARLNSLGGWMPELALPRFETAELAALLPALCTGRRSFAELRAAPLLEVLRGSLSHPQREALARHAPERLTLPSGSSARLDYRPGRNRSGEPPVLAARIQELFGLTETPRVAGGRVPVLLHLLAPNRRPQQVTDDLASFWANTYPQVRKELRGRYPKHPWPEDPTTATAQRRPGRRR